MKIYFYRMKIIFIEFCYISATINAGMISLYSMSASECIECSEKFLFLYEIFQIDSNNETC